MVLEQKQTHIAYHCPYCGMAVLGYVGEFALAADMLKLKCDCGQSELTVTYTNDKKIRLSVPCLFCDSPHSFVVTQSLFFERETFLLGCPYMGVDICFMGKPEALQKELDRSAKELNALFEENNLSLPSAKEGKETDETEEDEGVENSMPEDPQIYDIIHYVIKDLEAEGKIECPCGTGPYEVEILPQGVKVFCAECGAENLFKIHSLGSAMEFLHCDSITLRHK